MSCRIVGGERCDPGDQGRRIENAAQPFERAEQQRQTTDGHHVGVSGSGQRGIAEPDKVDPSGVANALDCFWQRVDASERDMGHGMDRRENHSDHEKSRAATVDSLLRLHACQEGMLHAEIDADDIGADEHDRGGQPHPLERDDVDGGPSQRHCGHDSHDEGDPSIAQQEDGRDRRGLCDDGEYARREFGPRIGDRNEEEETDLDQENEESVLREAKMPEPPRTRGLPQPTHDAAANHTVPRSKAFRKPGHIAGGVMT